MFRRRFGLALLVAGTLGVAAAGMFRAGPASAITNCDTAEAGTSSAEQQMLVLFNGARAAAGVPPLKFSPNLNRAAAWKSEDSSAAGTGFSHTDSLGRDTVKQPPKNRAIDCGYPTWAAEDIAYGSSAATTIFGMWMNSSGHRANILDRNAVVVGIGESRGRWTADFGSVDDSGNTSPATATPTLTPTLASAGAATATPAARPTNTPTATPTTRPTNTPTPTPTASPAATAGVSVDLYSGMNLVTYAGPVQPVGAAIASLRGQLAAIYAWNPDQGAWDRYAPAVPAYAATIAQLAPGQVYFLELTAPAEWTY